MKIAFFSDIHANLPSLEAVLADIDSRKPDAIYCLGDLVGYAPWPNEVVQQIRSRYIPTIAGNYDEGVGNASDDCGCAYKTDEDKARGEDSITYTNRVIGKEERVYLRTLPRHIRLEFEISKGSRDNKKLQLLMVHGSPRKINEYLFADRDKKSMVRIMEQANADIMLFGHTHKPYHQKFASEEEGATAFRHAINIGSVGKPKDGDNRACYVMLELDEKTTREDPASFKVEFIRVPYDVEKAAHAVEESLLPNEFADMLRKAY